MNERLTSEEKIRMQAEINALLARYREIEDMISRYQAGTGPSEYRQFWQKIKIKNRELINQAASFMSCKTGRCR